MTEEGGNSNALTIYIFVCFLLAGGVGVGYKLIEDKRSEAADSYVHSVSQFHEMALSLSPSVATYYELVKDGVLKPASATTKARTAEDLLVYARTTMRLKYGQGRDVDQIMIPSAANSSSRRSYVEHTLPVTLQKVTQAQWAQFLGFVRERTDKYATITNIKISRSEKKYEDVPVSREVGQKRWSDQSAWSVTLEIKWFSPVTKSDKKAGT